jgi:predicted AlkP superfamily pyrophosphatase or phosphodiesterase
MKKHSRINRRLFLKKSGAFLGSALLWGKELFFANNVFAKDTISRNTNPPGKLIFVAIDALHPKYFELDAKGFPGGKDGNWLMPNIRKFLKKSVWFPNAQCFLPSATDMNHLNALAGTSTSQTGVIGVWAQPTGWDAKGKPVIKHSHISLAKDNHGRPVDTLFHSWKRKWPNSKTLLITGKEWVGEMFRQPDSKSVIDILVTGPKHPDFLSDPQKDSFTDPLSDTDAACDPESKRFKISDWKFGSRSNMMTSAYVGQHSLLTMQMEHFANHFPHDTWIVDSTLEIFKRENPDLAYILLAQCDDAGHCIGNAWDPSEFVNADKPYIPPEGCENKPEYQLVSRRNKYLYKEPALDMIRDLDIQFGRLINGLKTQKALDNATILLLSDHSAINHLYSEDFSSTDAMDILKKANLASNKQVYLFSVSSYGCLYWRDHKELISKAEEKLKAHKALNPQTGKWECPWWVVNRNDMKNGIEGVCLPGELYHKYYIEIDKEKSMIWPDLILLAKNGWQIPVYNGHIPNVGINAPKWTPPFRVYNGGHGSIDTLPIVAAISVPNGKTGISQKAIRIGDLGVTAASLFDLTLNSTTIGSDLSKNLV